MIATLEPLQAKPKPRRNRFTWTKQQAEAARIKGVESRRKRAEAKRQEDQRAAQLLADITAADPITDVERALSVASKHGKAKAVESLASALAKLKRAGVGRSEPSASYTPTSSSPPRQPTPSTPQVTQAHAIEAHAPGANFAQCGEPLVGQGKESLSSVIVGCPGPGEAPRGKAACGVIEHITRTAYSGVDGTVKPGQVYASPQEEIAALEARLAVLKGQVSQHKPQVPVQGNSVGKPSSVGVVSSGSGVGVGVAPVEKFCVNGHWIAGVRKK